MTQDQNILILPLCRLLPMVGLGILLSCCGCQTSLVETKIVTAVDETRNEDVVEEVSLEEEYRISAMSVTQGIISGRVVLRSERQCRIHTLAKTPVYTETYETPYKPVDPIVGLLELPLSPLRALLFGPEEAINEFRRLDYSNKRLVSRAITDYKSEEINSRLTTSVSNRVASHCPITLTANEPVFLQGRASCSVQSDSNGRFMANIHSPPFFMDRQAAASYGSGLLSDILLNKTHLAKLTTVASPSSKNIIIRARTTVSSPEDIGRGTASVTKRLYVVDQSKLEASARKLIASLTTCQKPPFTLATKDIAKTLAQTSNSATVIFEDCCVQLIEISNTSDSLPRATGLISGRIHNRLDAVLDRLEQCLSVMNQLMNRKE